MALKSGYFKKIRKSLFLPKCKLILKLLLLKYQRVEHVVHGSVENK